MTEEQADQVLTTTKDPTRRYTAVIKSGRSATAASHAAENGDLACGTRPRADRTPEVISQDLAP